MQKALITPLLILISYSVFSQGKVEIDTDILMEVSDKEVLISNSVFKVKADGEQPLLHGDFGAKKIGINTNSPSEALEISNGSLLFSKSWDSGNSTKLMLSSYVSQENYPGPEITTGNGTGSGAYGKYGSLIIKGRNASGGNGNIYFVNGAGTGYATRMLIRHNGDVEIYDDLEVHDQAKKPGGGSWSDLSDKRLKKNITVVDNGLDEIDKLKPVKYQWINPEEHGDRQEQIGFLAQDVYEHFPEWIGETEPDGNDVDLFEAEEMAMTLSLPFDFDAIVVSAIKKLKKENEELKSSNDEMKDLITELTKRITALEAAQ